MAHTTGRRSQRRLPLARHLAQEFERDVPLVGTLRLAVDRADDRSRRARAAPARSGAIGPEREEEPVAHSASSRSSARRTVQRRTSSRPPGNCSRCVSMSQCTVRVRARPRPARPCPRACRACRRPARPRRSRRRPRCCRVRARAPCRHRPHDRLADGTVLLPAASSGTPRNATLSGIRIGDHAAQEPARTAGHVGAGLGDPAAGAGFGRDERLGPRPPDGRPRPRASCCRSTSVGAVMRQFYRPLASSGTPSLSCKPRLGYPTNRQEPMKIASLAVALAVAAFPVLTHAQAAPATQSVKADEQIILKQVMTDKRAVVRAEPAAHGRREPRVLADLRRVRRQGQEAQRRVPRAGRRLRRQVRHDDRRRRHGDAQDARCRSRRTARTSSRPTRRRSPRCCRR